jgi:hypothetical protein
MSDHDEIRAFITDPALQQRLAKYMVLQCFRNSMLIDPLSHQPPNTAENHRNITETGLICKVLRDP